MAKKKLKIALIYGGTSEERKVSLNSAKSILENLDASKYLIEKIEVKKTDWISGSIQKLLKSDVALLALHGPGGEDGTVQGLLELIGIPYTGSGVLASALAMDKAKTKRLVASEGINVAPHIIIQRQDYEKNRGKFLNKLKDKVVIKPNRIGSSIGVTISDDKLQIRAGIETAFEHDDEVMMEAYIEGREFTVPVLGNTKLRTLPVIEIKPKHGSGFFDFRAKYDPNFSDEIVSPKIPQALKNKLQEIALTTHKLLDCRGVTRSDFIVNAKGEIYFLEINTLPGMTNNSLVPKAAKHIGLSYAKLLDKLIQLAQNKE